MNNLEPVPVDNQEEGYNLTELIRRLWDNKFVIIFFFLLGVAGAYTYVYYSISQYEVFSTVLVKRDSQTSLSIESVFDDLGVNSGQKELENEVAILSSYAIVKEVLKELDFKVSYFDENLQKTRELYINSFFEVDYDTTKAVLVDTRFTFRLLDDQKNLEVSYYTEGGLLEDQIDPKKSQSFIIEMQGTHPARFGQWFDTKAGKFRIRLKNPNLDLSSMVDRSYSFMVHSNDGLLQAYQAGLSVEALDETSVIRLSLVSPVIQKAKDFLNQLSMVYINLGLQEKRETATLAIKFIDAQLEEIQTDLLSTQEDLEDYQVSNEVIDPKLLASDAYETLRKLDTEKFELDLQLDYFDYLKQSLVNQDSNVVSPSIIGIPDPSLEALVDNYRALNEEFINMSLSLRPENPYFKSFEVRFNHAKDLLNENLDNLKSASELRITELNRKIDDVEKELKGIPSTEYEMANLRRQLDISDQIYTFLLEKKSEAAISQASTISDKTVLDEARLSRKVSPILSTIYALGGISGLIVSVIIVYILSLVDHKIKSMDQLKQSIPQIPILGMVTRFVGKNNIAITETSKSIIAESFQSLRLNLKYLTKNGKPGQVFSVTSHLPGEGKTFISINLGLVLAKSGKKCLLIGSDLRKPKIFEDFDKTNSRGLSQLLIGELTMDEAILATDYSNLDLLLSGPVPPNPIELLEGERFGEVMAELRLKYDYIVLDTAPVGLVSDWKIISELCDQSIYVVRENYSHSNSIQFIKNLFQEKGNTGICIVYNDHKVTRSKYGGSYGYGYGYGYYDNENEGRIKNRVLKTLKRK